MRNKDINHRRIFKKMLDFERVKSYSERVNLGSGDGSGGRIYGYFVLRYIRVFTKDL